MGSVNVSASGYASANAYGVSVDSSGNVDLSGLVDKVMATLDSHAPNFVKALVNAAAMAGATELAIEGAIATAVAALPAELGASVALLGPFAPVAAIVLAIPALLVALDPASGGTGCCGTKPYTREGAIDQLRFEHDPLNLLPATQHNFMPAESAINNLLMYSGQDATAAPCDPSKYTWESTEGSYTKAKAGTFQAFVDTAIESAYNSTNGCWSYLHPTQYPIVLAAAIGAWQRAHPGAVSLSRHVNNTTHHAAIPGGFGAYTSTGDAQDNEPISHAMNYAAMRFDAKGNPQGFLPGVKAGSSASINYNSAKGAIIVPLKGIGTSLMALPTTIPKLLPIKISFPPVKEAPIDLTKPVTPASLANPPTTTGSSLTVLGMPAKTVGAVGIGAGLLAGGWYLLKKHIL